MQNMWFHSTASKTKAMEIALLNKKKNNQKTATKSQINVGMCVWVAG